MIGKELGQYQVIEALGEGGMASVYRAHDKRLDRDVAIKVILPGFSHSVAFLKRFEREARSIAKLTHTNIVGVINYGSDEGIPYLVMEYVSGGTLKDLLGKPIPWKKAAQMLVPIAKALEYAHRKNIIHRDIKPGNFLVTDSGDLMISDFGIAKTLDEDLTKLTGTGVSVGTPAYMSPEQGLQKEVDHRVDIYSLGIVFFEMITGKIPFEADTPFSVMMKHVNDPIPRPSDIVPDLPEEVEKVLFKALEKNPDDRYQSMGEFAEALEQLRSIQEKKIFENKIVQVISKRDELTNETLEISGSSKKTGGDTPIRTSLTKKVNFKLWGIIGSTTLLVAIIVVGSLILGDSNSSLGMLSETKTHEPTKTTQATLLSSETPKSTKVKATEIILPTSISKPSPTLTTEPSPSSTLTETPNENQTGILLQDTIARSGPGNNYRWVAGSPYQAGIEVTIIGRSLDELWLVVILPNENEGWVNASNIETSTDIVSLPIIEAPPTPMFIPTNTKTPKPQSEPPSEPATVAPPPYPGPGSG